MKSLVFKASGIRQIFAMVAIFAMMVFSVQGAFVRIAEARDAELPTGTLDANTQVDLCHDNNGASDYSLVQAKASAIVYEENAGHPPEAGHATDIIPPFDYYFGDQDGESGTFPGRNWGTGEETFLNNCSAPVEPALGSITVLKDTDDASGDSVEFSFSSAELGAFSVLGDGVDSFSSTSLLAGPYTITEDGETGWSYGSVDCGAASVSPAGEGDGVTITLGEGEDVTCTFSNTMDVALCEDPGALNNGQEAPCEYPQVTLCKKDPTGAPLGGWELFLENTDFSGVTAASDADVNAGCVTLTDVPLGTYTLGEDLAAHAGWVNVSGNGDEITITESTETWTWTLVNEELPPNVGTIIVEKEVLNTTVPYDSFWFSVNDGDPIQFEADGTNEFQYEAGTVVSVVETTTGDFATAYTNCTEVEIVEGQAQTCTITNRYPIVPTYYVDGYKWNDEDGDGLWDEGENALSDWKIEITDGEVTYATSTDAEGYYWFEVPAGTWTVSEVQQGGWEQTAPETGVCEYSFGMQTLFTRAIVADDIAMNRCNFGNVEDETLTCSLTSSTDVAARGSDFELSWTGSSELTYMEIDNGIGEVSAPNGSEETSINSKTTFTMTAYEWVEYGEGDEIVDHSDPVYCDVTVDVRSSGGGGGGSTRPVCEAFSLDDDTLSWETRRGDDLVITVNGAEIYSLNDDEDGQDALDEGSLTTAPVAGGEYELTVSRGSREDTCSFTLPRPEVAGEQISVVPLGAADTGAGGATGGTLPMTFALLGMLASVAAIRVTRNG